MTIEKNIRLEPHESRDLLVRKKSNKKRPKYQPPSQGGGHANVGGSGGNGSHDRGGGQHRTTAARHTPTRAKDRHPGESTGKERAIANRTYNRPNRVTYTGPRVHGEGIGSQTFNKNLRTIQRRHDYNRGAYERAHPFLSKVGGLGGLFGALGRGALSFFGGLPGKALSGIMTAKNWAQNKGAGFMKGVGEFAEYDEEGNPKYQTWDRFINRNTGKYDDKPYLGHGKSNYTFNDQVATDVTNPNLNLNTIDTIDTNYIPQNVPSDEELLNFQPYKEGGRIGYERGRVVNPGGYAGDTWRDFLASQAEWQIRPNDDWRTVYHRWLDSQKADGGIARLL